MSSGQRQDGLVNSEPFKKGLVDAVTGKNTNSKKLLLWSIIAGSILLILAASRAYAGIIFSNPQEVKSAQVVHAQPTVEHIDAVGVSHQNDAQAQTQTQSTEIEAKNGKVRATVNGKPVELNQNGTTQLSLPNNDGSTTSITSTTYNGNTSNSFQSTTNVNSVNTTSQSNNFSSSSYQVQQSGNSEVQ